MSFARAGKTAANEAKYPYIVEVPIAANGLNVELNRQIVGFHKLHHTTLRFGRTALRDGQIYYRWCFFDLATARAFAEQFGGAFYKTTGTWLTPLLTMKARRIVVNIAKLPELWTPFRLSQIPAVIEAL
jgi:hypothetical protein